MFEKPYHGIHIFVKRKFGTFGKSKEICGFEGKDIFIYAHNNVKNGRRTLLLKYTFRLFYSYSSIT